MELKEQYKLLCNEYIRRFTKKQDIPWDRFDETNCWVGNNPGTVACINDMFLNFDDIRYDVDNNIEPDKIIDWYYKYLDRHEMGLQYMNYESYCKGTPDPIPAEKLRKIEALRQQVKEAKIALLEAIDEYSNGQNPTEELW